MMVSRKNNMVDRALQGWAERKRPSAEHLDALADRILRAVESERIHQVQEPPIVVVPLFRRIARLATAGAAVAAMVVLGYMLYVPPEPVVPGRVIDKAAVRRAAEEAEKRMARVRELPPIAPGELWQHDKKTGEALGQVAMHQPETPEFLQGLQEIASVLPEVPVGREHGTSTFRHVRMNEEARKIDAVVFRVPEGVPTDVIWALRYSPVADLRVYLAPSEGGQLAELKNTHSRIDWYGAGPLENRGELELKSRWLTADSLQPGQEYIVCVVFDTDKALDVGLAFNALEAKGVKWEHYEALKALGEYKGDMEHDKGHAAAGDPAKALEWYVKAAELGNVPSMEHLGDAYASGRGVGADLEKAEEWYEKFAQAGGLEAMHRIANKYYYGRSIPRNFAKAYKWFRRCAETGTEGALLAESMWYVAFMLERGQGVRRNRPESTQWYIKAADAGDTNAICSVGFLYRKGRGVKMDYAKALHYSTIGAERGRAYAMAELGWLYLKGAGVEKNDDTALFWLRKAVAGGNKAARPYLAKLEKRLAREAAKPKKAEKQKEKPAKKKRKPKPVEVKPVEIDEVVTKRTDSAEKNVEWLIYKDTFVARKEGDNIVNFTEFLDAREAKKLSVNGLSFTNDFVWAATSNGAFCYERKNGAWAEYAVNREHIGLPVDAVSIDKSGKIVFEMTIEGRKRSYSFNPASNTWAEGE